jgi:3-oxoacyl-[acyl-carrier-protein] synthase I
MPAQPIAITSTGLVTSVGLSAPATCAATRAGISNPSETRFLGADGEWIMAHQVQLDKPWRGRTKLVKMAAMTISEALAPLGDVVQESLPLLLCVAEQERPGRLEGLDDLLFEELEAELGVHFHPTLSAIVPQGRIGVAVALVQARKLIIEQHQERVLIAATDSLLTWPTLQYYQEAERLLSATNSNGFIPGESAGAFLVTAAASNAEGQLICRGVGYGTETAPIDSESPLRGDGLTQAVKAALVDAGLEMGDLDFRITDNSGEQYYFKEAALALSRILRVRKEEFDIWHPADCIGEVGAGIGAAIIAKALAAGRKAYARGNNILMHAGLDAGKRTAAVLQYAGAA